MKPTPASGTAFLRKILLSVWACFLAASCASPTSTPSPSTPSPTITPEYMACTLLPYATGVTEKMSEFINEYAHVIGSEQAPVTMLVFTDFQCPGCAVLEAALAQVRAAHPGEVRLVVRYLPDTRFDKSQLSMQAAEAADLQGKYWEMYSLLFAKQPEWYGLDPADFPAWARDQAEGLGMDAGQFEADFNGEEVATRVQQATLSASNITLFPPLLYINSTTQYNGMADASSLDQMVRLAILEGRKFHTCPRWIIDPSRQYILTLHTAHGDAVVQLYPEKAPLAVNNFVFLAQAGWYDNIPFHRAEAGFAIQGGDPSGTGYGNPGYYFATEVAPGLFFDHPGLLAMSNVGLDTNGSQFFITYAPAPQLDGQFTIFGEVLTGMDVLQSLSAGEILISTTVEER
jgi:cyclophilin family peptidyl-prolyl cis-trans isomerase/protein-disulfide isomerase